MRQRHDWRAANGQAVAQELLRAVYGPSQTRWTRLGCCGGMHLSRASASAPIRGLTVHCTHCCCCCCASHFGSADMNVTDELRELELFFEDEDNKESKSTGAPSQTYTNTYNDEGGKADRRRVCDQNARADRFATSARHALSELRLRDPCLHGGRVSPFWHLQHCGLRSAPSSPPHCAGHVGS